MSNITDIDDYRPHLCVMDKVDNVAHVVPLELVRDMADGIMPIDERDIPMIRGLMAMLIEEIES